jgi:hypothetical protein
LHIAGCGGYGPERDRGEEREIGPLRATGVLWPRISFPLRLVGKMHARLLQSGRGGTKSPGEFRRSQNWIGGSRPGNALFIPPPPTELDACLGALERFMHEDQSRLPAIIKGELIHVQFETIRPFLDGNGRMALTRLLRHLRSSPGCSPTRTPPWARWRRLSVRVRGLAASCPANPRPRPRC